MARTWEATGTGKFTGAGEARSARAAVKAFNRDKANKAGGKFKEELAKGVTQSHPEGKINFEQAMKQVKSGDTVILNGQRTKITAANKEKVLSRLAGQSKSAPIGPTPASAGRGGLPSSGTVTRFRGNMKDGKITKENKSSGGQGGGKNPTGGGKNQPVVPRTGGKNRGRK